MVNVLVTAVVHIVL